MKSVSFRSVSLAISVLSASNVASAYEVKGLTPGIAVTAEMTQGCTQTSNADSGVPGYECNNLTLGGEPASSRLIVHDNKLVGVVFEVKGVQMQPVLKAYEDKYGTARKPNRYIENYDWISGSQVLRIKSNITGSGYQVMLIDLDMFGAAESSIKEKVKKDL